MTQRASAANVVSGLQCRLPLIVGVTGHRDLRAADIPALEQNVREVFARIREDYLEGDADTPLVVMSSLAEGADQLVAGVALESGAALVAPLPMPADEYRRDFDGEAEDGAARAFDRLLASAVAAPVMPMVDGASLDVIRTDPRLRALQYREAGLFIVQHCHILLALWDGQEQGAKTGGTAEIVSFKKHGLPLGVCADPRQCIGAGSIGPVITIATPRRDGPARGVAVSTPPWGRDLLDAARSDPGLAEAARGWQDFEIWMRLTNGYNRDARAFLSTPHGAEALRSSLIGLFDAPLALKKIATAGRSMALHEAPLLCATYALADLLAQVYQDRFRKVWQSLFLIALTMAIIIGLSSGATSAVKTYALVAYQSLFVCSFAIYFFARRRQFQERYLDYRALSETARVGVFWRIAGVRKTAAEAYPPGQSQELSWVRLSLQALDCLGRSGTQTETPLDDLRYRICREVWARGQYDYFRNRGAAHKQAARRSKTLSLTFIVIAGLGTLMIGASDALSLDWKSYAPTGVAARLPFLLELLPALGAAVQGYAEQLGRTAQALQFDRMRTLYAQTLAVLPETIEESQAELARDLFQALGQESIQEAASWTSIFRLRPLKPV